MRCDYFSSMFSAKICSRIGFNAVNSNTLFREAERILERKVFFFFFIAIAMMVYVPFIVASTSLG